MKTILLMALVILAACEFTNDSQPKFEIDGVFTYNTDSSSIYWEFKTGEDFFERFTLRCDTTETQSKFAHSDTILTLTSVHVRATETGSCPSKMSAWSSLSHLEYVAKFDSKGDLFVMFSNTRGRNGYWVPFQKAK